MTGPGEERIREAFKTQAQFCRASGSPLTADILDALITVLDRSTRTGAAILDWPGDPMVDALKLRIAGGLNALARAGLDPELTALYAVRSGDFEGVLRRVVAEHDQWLLPWLDGPPQTNEVARAGALWPGIMAVAARFGPDVELIELGPSAGLNMNMDRFAYDLGGAIAGDPGSGVRIEPQWSGPAPIVAPVNIVSRIGIDRNPLDVSRPEVADRLLAYVWPDQRERVARAEAAIALARHYPPPIESGDAAEWLERKLAEPQAEGVARIVYHSIVLQYLPPEGRARVREALRAAGARASGTRPLAWLSMEFSAESATAEIRLTSWPDAKPRKLGDTHPHGAFVQWNG